MPTRTDGQLLSDVASDGSEAAFEQLVQRHGSMVLNQSLRLLSDRQDAEDAAQAVFLVLWNKAASLRNRLSVAAWLHRTTRNVCRNAQRSTLARRLRERKATDMKQSSPCELQRWNEIKHVLDEELDRLPEKYRLPLILFHLEGWPLDEIAELTNSNSSTVGTRLRRGREMLRKGIVRRGITIETATLIAAIGIHAGATALSASFVSATAHSASLFAAGKILPTTLLSPQSIALAKGTLHMLTITKFKIVAAAVAAVFVVGGVSGLMVSAVLRADTPQADTVLAASQESSKNDETDRITLKAIIATLEKQREQVKSLTIETRSYGKTLVEPKVLRSWKRFGGPKVTNQQAEYTSFQQEDVFAYKGGMRYLRMFQTAEEKPDDDEATGARQVIYNSERASDGKRVWERRVNLKLGPAQVFVLSVKPGQRWTQNPVYCRNFGWDCMTTLHTEDKASLQRHREIDFLSLLKEGAFSIDPEITLLNGVKCVVLRREFQAELAEFDPVKGEAVVFRDPALETIWLDRDRGFAMLRRDQLFERWGLDRTINSEFVEILPGIWFPQKTKTQPFAPPDAPQEYQGRPVQSWNVDLIRWSVNDVPDNRFDMITKPGDHLIQKGEKVRVIGDDNQPIDQMTGISQTTASEFNDRATSKSAPKPLNAEEKRLVELLAKAGDVAKPETAKLRVAIATGKRCNLPGKFIERLKTHAACRCEKVALKDIGEGALNSYDVLLVPGGNSERQAEQLGESGRRAIREFVERGGGYVGVCAGGILATTSFDWSLNLVNAGTLSDKVQTPGPDGVMTVDMGKRGSGTVTMELTDAGRQILAGRTGLIETGFHLGPVFVPNQQSDLPKCLPLGEYRSEVWLHKLQIGTMVNSPSILAAQYGKGRVVIFSSHPEGREETEPMLVRAVLATARNPAIAD